MTQLRFREDLEDEVTSRHGWGVLGHSLKAVPEVEDEDLTLIDVALANKIRGTRQYRAKSPCLSAGRVPYMSPDIMETKYVLGATAYEAVVKGHALLTEKYSPSDKYILADFDVPGVHFRVFPHFSPGMIAARVARIDPWERALAALSALRNGWAGEGTSAPNEAILRDVHTVAEIAQYAQRRVPQCSVDDRNGYVSLRWTLDKDPGFFALGIRGDGMVRVSARSSDRAQALAEQVSVREDARLAEILAHPSYDNLSR